MICEMQNQHTLKFQTTKVRQKNDENAKQKKGLSVF